MERVFPTLLDFEMAAYVSKHLESKELKYCWVRE
jgi:hypothetical protein